MSPAAVLALGFFLGMRHATDPDHVVAVSTIVARERTLRAAAPVGVLWGVGHTLTIFLVGGAIILFDVVVPPRLGLGMEFSVAIMLVLLGALNVRSIFVDARAIAHHGHDGHTHDHAEPLPAGLGRLGWARPATRPCKRGFDRQAGVPAMVPWRRLGEMCNDSGIMSQVGARRQAAGGVERLIHAAAALLSGGR